jgi:hypothetical protein
LGEGLGGFGFCGEFLGADEEGGEPAVVDCCLCQSLGHNDGLLEFEAEAEVD